MDFKRLYFAIRWFLWEFTREISADNNKAFDWITSRVVLDPLSYSAAIPSFAIFAELTCDITEFKKLLEDCKLDQALPTLVSVFLIDPSSSNLFFKIMFEFLLIVDLFFPPE